MTSGENRATYREALAVPEFRAIFVSQGLSLVGDHVARIAIALLVYARTGSAFAASATYGCSFLTWLVGGPVLSALADRHRRRHIMIVTDLARFALVALLLVPEPPLWLVFAVLVAVGLLAPPFESARSALLPDIVTGELYVAGNSLINTTIQGAQVAGFFIGGLLVSLISVRGALALDAATFLVSAAVLRLAIAERPVVERERTSLIGDVVAGVHFVRADPYLRGLLAYGVLAAVVAIVPEGLAVAVAGDDGNGARTAGILTATIPLGYVVASAVILRWSAEQRARQMLPLTLVLCLPLLLTPLVSGTALTAVLWLVAGAGTAVQLIASVAYVAGTAPEFRGRAFGLAGTALMLSQGVALLLAGALADLIGPRSVVAVAAGLGLLALVAMRSTLAGAQGNAQVRRRSTG
ncbi:MAG: MFS transporter [Frankiaceae bacterium]|nr:MFS transporter [Frankiaceae bacterium]